jgi:hypothetical protein
MKIPFVAIEAFAAAVSLAAAPPEVRSITAMRPAAVAIPAPHSTAGFGAV